MNLDRLLIDKIENRILVGIITFVGVMIIIGWISINEPARMASFTDQFEGRSIERGAYLYSQNCSTCHGIDGKGLGGRAPALNSPHLFGFDFMATERRQFEDLQRRIGNQQIVIDEHDELAAQIESGELTGEDLTNALNSLQELDTEYVAAVASIEELEPQLDDVISQMDAMRTQMASAIEKGYDPDSPERLRQVAWEGTLNSYVLTTLIHGRPGSQNYWPSGQGMAAWGQVAGGPLREDQLGDLTAYILNWDKDWTLDDLYEVNQFGKIPVDPATVVTGEIGEPIGNDVDAILAELPNYTGDPNNGQSIYNAKYACAGCHSNEVVGPPTQLTWQAATDGADGRPYAGDPTHYVVESVVNPGAFVVPPYANGAMPANFGERVTYQEMADIIAYLSSYDG